MKKIGLVQINTTFSGQNYFPYSVGLIQSYAKKYCQNITEFDFIDFVYKRVKINDAVNKLKNCDIIGFSLYVWNERISLKIASEIKKINPNCFIICGGPQVPDKSEEFLRKNSFIDLVVHGEGEHVFTLILQNFGNREWEKIPAVSFLKGGILKTTPKAGRFKILDEIPSPYLTGTFDNIIKNNPNEQWLALWETNRGCPFRCFTGNTKIITSKGKNKIIKNINVGDKLISFDETTNKLVETTVIKTFKRPVKEILKVTFDDGTIIRSTEEHPFYVNNKWTEAKNLKINDEIYHINFRDKISFNKKLYNNGKKIISIKRIKGTYKVYNMECHPHNNYFANYVLSHNCTYCDWGSAIQVKISKFDLDRLYKEVDWFANHKIEFVFCCDANYGILMRDVDITKYVVESKTKTGYPKVLSVQNTKNATERSYQVQKILSDGGLNKGVTLSVQSMDKNTLINVKRDNISLESYQELQRRFMRDKVETYSDMILALPGETYDTFMDGMNTIITNGQHNRIQFNNLSILPNAEMGNEEYQKKYGMSSVEAYIINMHGSPGDYEDESVQEKQKIVISTNSMPKEDWIKVRSSCWMSAFLHFDKLLQITLVVFSKQTGISYRNIFETFMDKNITKSFNIIDNIREYFVNEAIKLQNGGDEFCYSKSWLNIYWPADEYAFIKLVYENKIEGFYNECFDLLNSLVKSKNINFSENILKECINLNKNLLKLPFQLENIAIPLEYNILDYYKSIIENSPIELVKKQNVINIEKSKHFYNDWNLWLKEVVWYGNKKGGYLHTNYIPNYELEGHF